MLTLEYAKNPVWFNQEKINSIELIVKWEEFSDEMPFLACSYDVEAHGVDLYNRAKAGEFGEVASYIPPQPVPPTA
jgi:hypothetical protein